MALGLFFCFLGYKLFQVALFIVVTLVGAGLLLFICYATFLADNTSTALGWTMFSVCCAVGLLAGFLSIKL